MQQCCCVCSPENTSCLRSKSCGVALAVPCMRVLFDRVVGKGSRAGACIGLAWRPDDRLLLWLLQGFKNLYTLEKGIQNYLKEKGDDLWEGSLFVFDARMAVAPGVSLTAASLLHDVSLRASKAARM